MCKWIEMFSLSIIRKLFCKTFNAASSFPPIGLPLHGLYITGESQDHVALPFVYSFTGVVTCNFLEQCFEAHMIIIPFSKRAPRVKNVFHLL